MFTITKKIQGERKGVLTFTNLSSCMAHLAWLITSNKEPFVDNVTICGPSIWINLIKLPSKMEASGFMWMDKGK